jgi:uncharacterized membrane protein
MTTQQRDTGVDRPSPSQQSSRTETGAVSDRAKRAGSLVIGAALLLHGLRQRSVGCRPSVLPVELQFDIGIEGEHG